MEWSARQHVFNRREIHRVFDCMIADVQTLL